MHIVEKRDLSPRLLMLENKSPRGEGNSYTMRKSEKAQGYERIVGLR